MTTGRCSNISACFTKHHVWRPPPAVSLRTRCGSPIVRYFEHRLAVGFADTNVVGNVYFANYFLWQGKCREEFLRLHAPQVLEDFRAGYGMITKESSCVFHHETFAFQEILIRMYLEELTRTAIVLRFDFFRVDVEP